ncbi:hypothetical protein [Vibrio breoganii]|uniref:hypothetical protein n=1 Tax=Vibrio breoganii TaxID=553239 RepID=UPI000C84E0D6|nr:hypothetical protein [Vibrio breoganii]PMG89722.1 hypothetical protein BCU79_18445 [Vibrio breoganii]PMM80288.1 hypothetical protein BCT45_15215 [Vibrio breoganii]
MFFFWLLLSVAIGILASKYNRNGFLWFVISIFSSFVVAGILLLIIGKSEVKVDNTNIDKIKKAQQDFILIYCTNEELIKNNQELRKTFKELSDPEVHNSQKYSLIDIEKYTHTLLVEIARVEEINSIDTKTFQQEPDATMKKSYENIDSHISNILKEANKTEVKQMISSKRNKEISNSELAKHTATSYSTEKNEIENLKIEIEQLRIQVDNIKRHIGL